MLCVYVLIVIVILCDCNLRLPYTFGGVFSQRDVARLLRMKSLGLEPPPPPRMCIAKHLGNKGTGFAAAITVLWFVFGRRFGALLPRGATFGGSDGN